MASKYYSYKTNTGHTFKEARANLTHFLHIAYVGYFFYSDGKDCLREKILQQQKGSECLMGTVERLN